MQSQHIQHIVNTPVPMRLDRYLRRLYPNLTQGVLESAIRKRKIIINGSKIKSCTRVITGEVISADIRLLTELDNNRKHAFAISSPAVISLADKILGEYLLYSDNNIIAINKPSGLATQGGSKIKISIQDALHYLSLESNSEFDFKLIHRLDKDTSGVLIIAKNHLAAQKLSQEFRNCLIKKNYLAIVSGKLAQNSGNVQGIVPKMIRMRDTVGNFYLAATKKQTSNKYADTNYHLLASNSEVSLIKFSPSTGRMHQLRIHALKLGCPIIGDKKYGMNRLSNSQHNDYMLLHARELSIQAHVFGQEINIQAPLPEYFIQYIKQSWKISQTAILSLLNDH